MNTVIADRLTIIHLIATWLVGMLLAMRANGLFYRMAERIGVSRGDAMMSWKLFGILGKYVEQHGKDADYRRLMRLITAMFAFTFLSFIIGRILIVAFFGPDSITSRS